MRGFCLLVTGEITAFVELRFLSFEQSSFLQQETVQRR